jgi:hypothetical protein
MRSLAQLQAEINEAWRPDQHRLRRQWRAVARAQRSGRPFDRNLARLIEGIERSMVIRRTRAAGLPGGHA